MDSNIEVSSYNYLSCGGREGGLYTRDRHITVDSEEEKEREGLGLQ